MNDLEISTLVTSLSRPHPSGGTVIERAAILAAGADYPAIVDWIVAHSGTPETSAATGRSRGLHGSRITSGNTPASQQPLRFVLPPARSPEQRPLQAQAPGRSTDVVQREDNQPSAGRRPVQASSRP